MLTIRNAQREAFKAAARGRFEDELLRYLQDRMPARVEATGTAAIRACIRHGMDRARRHELRRGADIGLYVVLMLYLGSEFDDDPHLPWATDLLAAGRMDRLRDVALDFLARAEGEENEHLEAMLDKVRRWTLDELLPAPTGPLDVYLLARLKHLHPSKCAAIGDESLVHAATESLAEARRLGLVDDRAAALFAGLAFVLGHRFYRDPQYPVLAGAFADMAVRPMTVERLHRLARTLLPPPGEARAR